jgi:hypothetical protein
VIKYSWLNNILEMESEREIEQAMNKFLAHNDSKSPGDDRDYFELNYGDQNMSGSPLTPVTKYIKTSSKILVELRKQGTPMKNPWTPKAYTPATTRKTGAQDENHSPCSPNVASSPPILQKLRDHRGEGPKRSHSVKKVSPKQFSKSLLTQNSTEVVDYKDLVQSVMIDAKALDCSENNSDVTEQNVPAGISIDYGSPGTFSDRAMAFTRDMRGTSKDQNAQVTRHSIAVYNITNITALLQI